MSLRYGTRNQVSFWTRALNSSVIANWHFSSLEAQVYEVNYDSVQWVCKDKILLGSTVAEQDRFCIGWHWVMTIEEEDDIVWVKEERAGAKRGEMEEGYELDTRDAFGTAPWTEVGEDWVKLEPKDVVEAKGEEPKVNNGLRLDTTGLGGIDIDWTERKKNEAVEVELGIVDGDLGWGCEGRVLRMSNWSGEMLWTLGSGGWR